MKWKRDKKSKDRDKEGSVKIISEESGDEIGELNFSFNSKKERE